MKAVSSRPKRCVERIDVPIPSGPITMFGADGTRYVFDACDKCGRPEIPSAQVAELARNKIQVSRCENVE